MKPKRHIVKTISLYFDDSWKGIKKFEIRKNDRNYTVDDIFISKEFDAQSDFNRKRYC